MNEEQQLKLQAFLDGELPEAEAREVASWLARDAEATSLHGELKNTRKALANFERAINLPESREFYWSKISRQIERTVPEPKMRQHALFSFWRRAFAVAGGVAALAVALLVAMLPAKNSAPETETAMADGGAMTFRNFESGTTLVWLSYPAENGLADTQPGTTIQ